MDFNELFEMHVGTMLVRQSRFADWLADSKWEIDLERASIVMAHGDDHSLQLLGTQSESEDRWSWSWADDRMAPYEAALAFAHRLHTFGENYSIPEFKTPEIVLNEMLTVEKLAMLSAGLEKRTCYVRSPIEGGMLFGLMGGLPESIFNPLSVQEIMLMVPQLLSSFEGINHKAAIYYFLSDQGFEWKEKGLAVQAQRGSDVVSMEFDEYNRLTSLQGAIAE